jgi:hypothetical protein
MGFISGSQDFAAPTRPTAGWLAVTSLLDDSLPS